MAASDLTKKAIALSLKEILKVKPLSKVTIKDITDQCGVNRQTFYYHFDDVVGLVDWIYETEAIGRIDDYKSYDTWTEGLLRIFKYAEANKNFCLNTYHSFGRNHLNDFIYKATQKLILGVVLEVKAEKEKEVIGLKVSEKDIAFIADFYTFAFTGLVLNWIKDRMKTDPVEIVGELQRLIEGHFAMAIERFDQRGNT